MDIWEYFKGLFKKSEESSPSQPFIREAIERTEVERKDYELWKRTRARDKMLDFINEEYANFLIEPEKLHKGIDILNTPSAKGFVLYFSDIRDNSKDFLHLFDYLKEQVLGIGYKLYMSDTRTYNKPLWVETVQRHYLKPPLKFEGETTHDMIFYQRFGNIMIELLFHNDQTVNLKFKAMSYQSRNFSAVENFSDLMRKISKK